MKSNIRLIICQFVLLVFVLLINFLFIPKYLTNVDNIQIIGLTVIFILSLLLLGYTKKKNKFCTDSLQILIIFLFSYFIVYYLLGLFIGFYKNIYSLELLAIIKNLSYSIIPIILIETIRYMNSSNVKSRLLLITLTILIATLEISIFIPRYTFKDAESIFTFCGLVLIPILAKNILFTYLANKTNTSLSIFYRLITESSLFLIPIIPNLGVYIDSIINTALPIIILIRLEKIDILNDKRQRIRYKTNNVFTIPVFILLFIIVVLVSGLFKYKMIGVMSNSMKPCFIRGDALIIEKIKKEDIKNIETGYIIMYNLDNKVVVHRVDDIKKEGDKILFITKGDNNDTRDALDVKPEQIKGRVILRIKYIGFPSVWINDIIK